MEKDKDKKTVKTVTITEEEYVEYKKLRKSHMYISDIFIEIKKKLLGLELLASAINNPDNPQELLLSLMVDSAFDSSKLIDKMGKYIFN